MPQGRFGSAVSWSIRRADVAQHRFLERVRGLDPLDWQAIAIPQKEAPDVLYIPIPKAANTSLRHALCQTLGIDRSTVTNIHQDPRLPKVALRAALETCPQEAFVFTIVRHPVDRSLSAYRNKVAGTPRMFGPGRRLGLSPQDSFETFLGKCADVPPEVLDSHFKPQTLLLHYALEHPGLAIYTVDALPTIWPDICEEFTKRGLISPADQVSKLNTTKPRKHDLSPQEAKLIEQLYASDFEAFGFEI